MYYVLIKVEKVKIDEKSVNVIVTTKDVFTDKKDALAASEIVRPLNTEDIVYLLQEVERILPVEEVLSVPGETL